MTRIRRFVQNLTISTVMVLGIFSRTGLLTHQAGNYCWRPRFGGLLVGLAVLAPRLRLSQPRCLQRIGRDRLTREQRVTHVACVATVFGTLPWSFGDFLN